MQHACGFVHDHFEIIPLRRRSSARTHNHESITNTCQTEPTALRQLVPGNNTFGVNFAGYLSWALMTVQTGNRDIEIVIYNAVPGAAHARGTALCDGYIYNAGVQSVSQTMPPFGSEQCDDGNTVSGDGCSSQCAVEGCPDNDADGVCDSADKCELYDDNIALNGTGTYPGDINNSGTRSDVCPCLRTGGVHFGANFVAGAPPSATVRQNWQNFRIQRRQVSQTVARFGVSRCVAIKTRLAEPVQARQPKGWHKRLPMEQRRRRLSVEGKAGPREAGQASRALLPTPVAGRAETRPMPSGPTS